VAKTPDWRRWIRRQRGGWNLRGRRRWAGRRGSRSSSAEGGVYDTTQFLLAEGSKRDLDALDKEKRCPVDSDRSRAFLIQLDPLLNLFGIHVPFEALDIQSKFGRIPLESGANFRRSLGWWWNVRYPRGRHGWTGSARFAPNHGILKQHVVHLPKSSLHACCFRGAGRRHCVRMHGQRKLSKDDAHTFRIVVFHFQERRSQETARRTLKIAELFQSYARVRGAANVCWFRPRLTRRNLEGRARFRLVEKQCASSSHQ